jgi:hypothetical protein
MGHARFHTPDEDHLWRNARQRRAGCPDLLHGLSLQPLNTDHRGQVAR